MTEISYFSYSLDIYQQKRQPVCRCIRTLSYTIAQIKPFWDGQNTIAWINPFRDEQNTLENNSYNWQGWHGC